MVADSGLAVSSVSGAIAGLEFAPPISSMEDSNYAEFLGVTYRLAFCPRGSSSYGIFTFLNNVILLKRSRKSADHVWFPILKAKKDLGLCKFA